MDNSQFYSKTNQYRQIFKRRWLPALVTFVTVSTWGIVSTAIKPDLYEAEVKLKLPKTNAMTSIAEPSSELELLSTAPENSSSIKAEAQIIQSAPIIQKTIEQLRLKNSAGKALTVEDFRERLNVTEIPTTELLRITYQNVDPQLAKVTVATLIDRYLENKVTTDKIEVREAKTSLKKQISQAQKELLADERAIAELKTNRQILSPQKEVARLLNSLENIENRLIDAKSQLSNIDSQSQYIEDQLQMDARQALNATTISQSSIVQNIVTRLQELETQLETEQARFNNNHPSIIDLQAKISRQESLLAEQIKNVTGADFFLSKDDPQLAQTKQELAVELITLQSSSVGLTQEIAYLTETKKALKQQIGNFPEIEQQLNRLERELATSQKTYELLENQSSLLAIASLDREPVRVISHATIPDTPISNRSIGYTMAIAFGLLCGTIVIYLLEAKDRSLKTVEKAKQLFGYNWLGIIPSFETTPKFTNFLEAARGQNNLKNKPLAIAPIAIKEQPDSSVSESYRMLQSNLRFLKSDRQTQTIVITSSVSQEGKSTVAANLAGAMAQVGHKVLLVDADFHSPTQHSIWNTYSDSGLSELLTENLDSRLIAEQVMKNLSVIGAGKISSSPATLLDSHKMKDLMYHWTKNYDFVIIDSPALETAADAPILSRIADGVLFVVKPDRINRSQANFAKETLQRSGINVLGLVFNDINPKIDASSHYYRSVEEKGDTSLDRQLTSEPEELWESICRIAQESPQLRLSSVTAPEQLLEVPIDCLEETLARLQKELEKLTSFVKEQEDELIVKRQIVKKLERQVNIAPIPDRFALERELAEEQEKKQMLDRTLVGQRSNLARKREIMRQYQEMLAIEPK